MSKYLKHQGEWYVKVEAEQAVIEAAEALRRRVMGYNGTAHPTEDGGVLALDDPALVAVCSTVRALRGARDE